MRATRIRPLAIAVVVALGLVSAAAAQSPRQFCDVTVADAPSNGERLHPSTVYAGLTAPIARNEWGQIAQTLEDDFRGSTAPLTADARGKFARQLKAFADEMVAVEQSERAADILSRADAVNQVRFDILTDVDTSGYRLFPGGLDEIAIAATEANAVARDLCYRAWAVKKVLVRYGQPGRERAVKALAGYVTLWDNYNSKGYSQYPWELYLNGRWTVDAGSFAPPASQWVLAHPAIAVEVAWPRSQDLRRLDIITFEPIGYLRYRRDRRSYGGLSLLATLSAAADPGYGVLGHIGRIGKVGYVYHPREEEGARHGAVFSVDLYKLIGGVPQKLQDAKARVEALRNDALRAIP